MTRDEIKKSVDDKYAMPLRDPRAEAGCFVSMPKILNDPVKSVGECLDEIGLVQKMDCQPIQNLLVWLLEYEVSVYHQQIGAWVRMFESDLPIIGNWLAICRIDIEEYIAMLRNNCSADGLEVWITSLALGQPLNVIFESVVWSTMGDSFDHAYPSLLLTSYEEAILCEQEP